MSNRQVFVFFAFVFLFLFIANILINKGDAVIWMNAHYADFPNTFFKYMTYFGDGIIFVPIVLIGLFIRYEISITAAFTGILLAIVMGILKRQIFADFNRPKAFFEGVYQLNFIDGVDVHSHYSFPSGHTATAATAALLLALYSRRPVVVSFLALIAVLVGVSRVYLAQHFWVDITYGFITGMAVTFAARWLSNTWLRNRNWSRKSLADSFSKKG